ncbi:tRNA (5-methylaminomethyl-2-thiouridine)(34)-methyltransferase MnmD [Kangiella sp. TOML190]|uniref:tRNA (5-methylaminomethyl-2-thiouridine)(34)-methyltransferase MnmD n=1 Tax=Kangiella sp. TOML190 TaxID=2931351 RepID=UPI00203DDC1D|nr:tRNA (5-methylaminomethyl-2-thiouridine)(34)-methyltransferase MnmD [Kangiella sp. TOML190]
MHNAFQAVEPAKLEWRQIARNGSNYLAPYSTAFDDIYFNTHNGIEESEYVFLQGNQLEERFSKQPKQFTIFETGFGSGLNFLLSASLWEQTNPNGKLDYYSVEQFPIKPDDLSKIYQQLKLKELLNPFIANIIDKLLTDYPPILPGVYPIQISSKITLHLLFFPLEQALKEIAVNASFSVDAWFLDGFAPSKNPQMWHKGLWHFMALHSHSANASDPNNTQSSSVATFTAASQVRKMLQYYGFEVIKRQGFGHKREMLTAKFVKKELSTPKPNLASSYLETRKPTKKIAIIGAGLAGCSSAYVLQKAGFAVEIFEQGSKLASGASKMPALLASPNFSIDHNSFSQLTFSGFYRLQQFFAEHSELVDAKQVLQLANEKYSDHQLQQYLELYQNRLHSELRWSSIENKTPRPTTVERKALLSPAIQINGEKLCEYWLKTIPSKHIHLNHKITSLDQLSGFDCLIIASGHGSLLNNLGLSELPAVMPLRGQLTSIKAPYRLDLPINYQGHLFQEDEQWHLGASFDNSLDESVWPADNQKNIELANQELGLALPANQKCSSKVGIRASSFDRFPFCGFYQNSEQQTIWLNYGYGTRGLNLTLLCAEVIAASLQNKTLPLSKNLLQRLSPKRIS